MSPSSGPLRTLVLFTFHAYGTWMPDRPQGYYQNRSGLKPQDDEQARRYRSRQRESPAIFDDHCQQVMLTSLQQSGVMQLWTLIALAVDDAHLHLLAGWHDERSPEHVQQRIKWALTRDLNAQVSRRTWFTKNGHDRRVRDRAHLDHLRDVYLPSHRGVCWDRRDESDQTAG